MYTQHPLRARPHAKAFTCAHSRNLYESCEIGAVTPFHPCNNPERQAEQLFVLVKSHQKIPKLKPLK